MNTLTNEERARIFAMYMPCDVMDLFNDSGGKFVGLDYNNNSVQVLHKAVWHLNYDEVKLLLMPLSKITDEHAIEVAKLWHKGALFNMWEIDTRTQGYLELVNKTTKQIIRIWSTGSIDFQLVVGNETLFDNCEAVVEMIDCIRELGYAIPYKGKSLFDLGIAIDKTTL